MNSDVCRRYRQLIGPYVLGHLGDEERSGLEAHLEGCGDCQTEVEELAPVASTMNRARPFQDQIDPPDHLADRVFHAVRHAAEVEGRRRKLVVLVTAAALLVFIAGGTLLLRDGSPPSVQLAGDPGMSATASVEAKAWGTAVDLRLEGLPAGKRFNVWLADDRGERVPAGSFRSIEGGELSVTLSSSMPLPDAATLGVSDNAGHTVMEARL